MPRPDLFRLEFHLQMDGPVRLHPFGWPTVHALFRVAFSAAGLDGHAFPTAVLPEAPQRLTPVLQRGDVYRTGCTIMATPSEAAMYADALVTGLTAVGAGLKLTATLEGNFHLQRVVDAGRLGDWPSGMPLAPLAVHTPVPVAGRMVLTFLSPYRATRPAAAVQQGHRFVDGDWFDMGLFIARLAERMGEVGLASGISLPETLPTIEQNDLHWFDVPYGPVGRRKTLGGVMGRLNVAGVTPEVARILAWGQWVGVGKNTSFGFGRYVLGDPPVRDDGPTWDDHHAGDLCLAINEVFGQSSMASRIEARPRHVPYEALEPINFMPLIRKIPDAQLRGRLHALMGDDRRWRWLSTWLDVVVPAADDDTCDPLVQAIGPLFLDLLAPIIEAGGGRLLREKSEIYVRRSPAARSQGRWYDNAPSPPFMPLPGECRQVADLPDGLWALCGPGLADITAEGHELICRYEDDRSPARFPLDQLSNVVIIGAVPLAPALLRRLSRHHITLTMVDELARVMTVCNSQTDDCGDAAGIGGVARTSMDAERRLAFCRRLVGVKISNYARLAAAMPDAKAEVQAMDQLSARAACGRSAAEIRGLEGAAAARWYALFGRSIPSQLGFSRRVAPHAPDVTNILLNFAQSLLHRHATLALRAAGLPASVGILHEPRSGHVALASDLQEMFRHIADRAVLEELGRGAPAHLRIIDRNGQAMIDPLLLRSMVRRLHAALALGCAVDTRPPRSYLHWIYFTARRWRDWFTGGTDELEMFVHPAPPLQLERQP